MSVISYKEIIKKEASNQTQSISWPPSGAAFHFHKDMTWTGTAEDVQSVTFSNGMRLDKEGDGLPILHTAEGFRFQGGAYLSASPVQSVTYRGLSIFGALTLEMPSGESTYNYPFELGSLAYMYIREDINRLQCRTNTTLTSSDPQLVTGNKVVLGMFGDEDHHDNTVSGAVWINGRMRVCSIGPVEVVNNKWNIGRAFKGVIHEAVGFVRMDGQPPATDLRPKEVNEKLMSLWNVT